MSSRSDDTPSGHVRDCGLPFPHTLPRQCSVTQATPVQGWIQSSALSWTPTHLVVVLWLGVAFVPILRPAAEVERRSVRMATERARRDTEVFINHIGCVHHGALGVELPAILVMRAHAPVISKIPQGILDRRNRWIFKHQAPRTGIEPIRAILRSAQVIAPRIARVLGRLCHNSRLTTRPRQGMNLYSRIYQDETSACEARPWPACAWQYHRRIRRRF